MAVKKKKSYKQCSVKGCRKKALGSGKCKKHAQRQKTSAASATKKAPPKTRKKVNPKKKKRAGQPSRKSVTKTSKIQNSHLKELCYDLGVVVKKINRLIS